MRINIREPSGRHLFSISTSEDVSGMGLKKMVMQRIHHVMAKKGVAQSSKTINIDAFRLVHYSKLVDDLGDLDICFEIEAEEQDIKENEVSVINMTMELRIRGGGVSRRHHLKKEQEKKKSTKTKDTKKSSQEIRNDAKEVASSVQQTLSLPAVQQADAILSSFMVLSEQNPSDALIGRLKILGEDDLKAIYDALSGSSGGSTDFKISQVSRHLFNPELKPRMFIMRPVASLRQRN